MRYKFSLSPKIKGYIEWQLEHYHEDKRQMEQYRMDMMPNGTAQYGHTCGRSSTPGDQTAATVERLMTNQYLQTTERTIAAIDRTLARCDDTTRKLIDLVYWRRTHTMIGAAMVCHLGKTAAYDRANGVLYGIALEMGLVSA